MPMFPAFSVEGVKIPRALIGINSLLGWSHTSRGRDEWIRRYFTVERIAEVFVAAVDLNEAVKFKSDTKVPQLDQ